MYSEASLMFMYCETSLHAGSGTSLGIVDLPIQRERFTDFPTVAGAGVKGAVREWFEKKAETETEPARKILKGSKIKAVFGPEGDAASDHAGAVSFTDARVLLFPVRSVKGIFAWITCPSALARLKRDVEMSGKEFSLQIREVKHKMEIEEVADGKAMGLSQNNVTIDSKIILEEFMFELVGQNESSNYWKMGTWIAERIFPNVTGTDTDEYKFWRNRFLKNFLILADNDFSDFVKHSTEINARIKLGAGKSSDTAKGGNLFYEENLPSEAVLYSGVLATKPFRPVNGLNDALGVVSYVQEMKSKRIQVGGDETLGRGIVKVNFL